MENKDKLVNVELSMSELFQLNLCIACRSAYCTTKWANAANPEEQKYTEAQLEYLSKLATKIQSFFPEK